MLMGGRLNETIEGEDIPVDVSDKLTEMGVVVCGNAEGIVNTVLKLMK